jgi:hypothetical protein
MRHRLWITVRSILLGWATLAAATYLVEGPLLRLTAGLLGGSWIPTAELILECAGLAAAGWMIGRWDRSGALLAVLVFAAMLAVWNFRLVPAMNVVWLFQLIVDSFGDSRYLEALGTAAVTHAFLFGSLFVGERLSRAREQAVSLFVSRRPGE